jgi:hypothetical protein
LSLSSARAGDILGWHPITMGIAPGVLNMTRKGFQWTLSAMDLLKFIHKQFIDAKLKPPRTPGELKY